MVECNYGKVALGKRKWLLLITVVILVVVLTLAAFQLSRYFEGMYPQVAIYPDDSNLSIRGVINSIEENHKAEGWGCLPYIPLLSTGKHI
ncbi:hypothetical protein IMZ68_01300 [Candidatus Bathyarchaeota archaeon]|nr:hypothetical protein [Candidatus Bathyarchaeota archaeon]